MSLDDAAAAAATTNIVVAADPLHGRVISVVMHGSRQEAFAAIVLALNVSKTVLMSWFHDVDMTA